MNRRGFRPDEVLFSPTNACNLSCAHCDVRHSPRSLPIADAERFLEQCKRLGVRRVGFTGGEPFLCLDFLCAVTRCAVRKEFLFDRIMTNAVWWRDENDLKVALIRLYNAGYDGSICVSVDAFHDQDLSKVARFIELAVDIWRRPDVVSIASVRGARDGQTTMMLRILNAQVRKSSREIFLKQFSIDMEPVGVAARLTGAWGRKWFDEDYCRGPGNVFFVMPDGAVKPCCGYANTRKELTIGNIKKDRAITIMHNAERSSFIRAVFKKGLTSVRKQIEACGIRFPGKTERHCFFCDYILTNVPKRILKKSITAIILILFIMTGADAAENIVSAKRCPEIPATVMKRVKVPRWYHEGLFWDGRMLWLANGEKGCVWVVEPSTGEVVSSIVPVGNFVEALVQSEEGKLYTTEWHAKKIYRVNRVGDALIPDKEYSFAPAHPAGLVTIRDRIYVVTWTRGMGTKFNLVEMDKDLVVIRSLSFRDIQEPDQLAWDGTFMWVSSWYDRRVYKIDIRTWEIVGYFCSPVSKTTGVAWDGDYMWVTGTFGDLYQMMIGAGESV